MAGQGYYGTIPNIATAYQNDPRTKLAQSMIATGTAGAPVAQGGWAVTDGLAKAAQAILGSVVQKGQDKKYAKREGDYTEALKAAAALAGNSPSDAAVMPPPTGINPATAPGPVPPPNPASAAATALAPPPVPQPGYAAQPPTASIGTFDPGASPPQPGVLPPGPSGPPQGAFPPMPAPTPPIPAMATDGPPAANFAPSGGASGGNAGMRPFSPAPPTGGGATNGLSALGLYKIGIVPIEGGTDPKTGAFRTSRKGAVGPGQVMPATAPEAARLAGLPFDPVKYRTDPEYNNALGAAYYAKQLQDFGDPVKAAAAYNGGAGRVRRAVRRAGPDGDWTSFLPDETQKYAANFAKRIGNAQVQGAGTPGADVGPVPGGTQEAVPGGLPMPTAQPNAPALPQAVKTRRIGIAQSLLSSGNPDLAAMAQTYLDKGLDEQNDSDKVANAQQYGRENIGYQAGLDDFNNARSDARSGVREDRKGAQDRNFQSREAYYGRQFNRSERIGTQQYNTSERKDTQQFTAGESDKQRQWQNLQNDKNNAASIYIAQLQIEGKKKTADEKRDAARQNFYLTPQGQRYMKDAGDNVQKNNEVITDMSALMDLNKDITTGGAAAGLYNTPYIGGAYGALNPKLGEFDAKAKASVLKLLGGLGTGISNADRDTINKAVPNSSYKKETNDNLAQGLIQIANRSNAYEVAKGDAIADGSANSFIRNWANYTKAVPIYKRDAKGQVYADTSAPSYEEWIAARPKFDATGKRVQ